MTPESKYPTSADVRRWHGTSAGIRLDDLVQEVKDLVTLARYEEAVSTAKRHRDAMVAIGGKDSPALQLALGELDVWYAHAQIYVGDTDEAIERLGRVVADLAGQKRLYETLPLGTRRWNQILGRAHNHIGYAYWMDRGNYEAALKEFSVAISYFLAEAKLTEELATAYDNMGRVYAQLGYRTRAELLIEHGRQIRQMIQNDYRHALSLNSKAIANLAFGQPYRALVTSKEALGIFRQQGEQGIRGVGLALITKGRAQRYLGAYWRYSRTPPRFERHLRAAIRTLEEARDVFLSVKEDIRVFQAYNELGCAYRELVALSQGSDTESALQAKHYLEESLEAAPKEKYPALYVDACEDLARTCFMLDERREAKSYLRRAERAIPGLYKVRRDSQLRAIPSEECVEDYWQQLGKIHVLRGDMMFDEERPPTSASQMRRVLEQYVLASCCFGRFLDRPLNPASALESTHLYPPSEPRLASHRLFIEHLYSRLRLLDAEDISRLRKEILPELEQTYALKPAWLDVFQQEVLELLVHTKTTEFAAE
jgi:tetratricopeptide (TPR) repeat protein